MLRQIEPAGDPLLRFLILEVVIKFGQCTQRYNLQCLPSRRKGGFVVIESMFPDEILSAPLQLTFYRIFVFFELLHIVYKRIIQKPKWSVTN